MAKQPEGLRPFQERVRSCVLQGKSVILQAPTGAGKTQGALAPYIQNLKQGGSALPIKCLYATPMRTLTDQFYQKYLPQIEKVAHKHGDATALQDYVRYYKQIERPAVSIQMGDQPDDPQLEALLTFCTIDQLLASFLAVPYSVGRRKANMNVGGVLGSYLVLDEFHLYPILREGQNIFGARTTTIAMLRLLSQVTRFVLMTATLSSEFVKELAALLNAEIVTVTDKELQQSIPGRSRIFERAEEPMDARRILAEHQQSGRDQCSLVVCNTVLRADKLFLSLQAAAPSDVEVVLLHSRFQQEDRQSQAREVGEALGPKQWENGRYAGRNLIVVATQVIEVGLDISVATLHTEIAPANSLIQRAGRCARYKSQQGKVIVYPLEAPNQAEKVSALPYNRERCDSTWEALARFEGEPMGFTQEQAWIDAVHTAEDLDLLQRYQRNEVLLRRQIFEGFNTNEVGARTKLIRDIAQVQILIHDNPNQAITEEPWRWQSFGMHPGSLQGKRWDALQARGDELGLEWVCQQAKLIEGKQQNNDGDDGIDNTQKAQYKWEEVTNPAEIAQALMIAFPSQLARYDKKLGFLLLDGLDEELALEPNGYQSTPLESPYKRRKSMGSSQESYQEHIQGLVRAYNQHLRHEIAYVARKLEQELQLPVGTVDHAVRLTIGCHDLGKLNRQWQEWALAWQTARYAWQKRPTYQIPTPGFCFAKTDNGDTKEEKDMQKQILPKRPYHACESVMLGRPLIAHNLGIVGKEGKELRPVWRAICGAIARHHAPQSSNYKPVQFDPKAQLAADEALYQAHSGSDWRYDPQPLCEVKVEGDLMPEVGRGGITFPSTEGGRPGELETWLYFTLVRVLRLADQRASR